MARKALDMTGKIVDITAKESWAYGEWGVIKYFDGEFYHVAIANDESTLVFSRNEFKVRRGKKQ